MDELLNQLYIKRKKLDSIIKYAENYLHTAPQGTLYVKKHNNTVQYYMKNELLPCGEEHSDLFHDIYISKKNKSLICALAQKDYAQELLSQAKEERKSIQYLIDRYEPEAIENVYNKLPLRRQEIVKPYILPTNQFVEQWMETEYERKRIDVDEQSQIVTERGETVRSKSEKILADKLNILQIPYHYEKPLYINGYGNIYPDFTVLNKRTRKEYYWEHLGLMDQAGYCENVIKKIEGMQNNGIFLGDRLILTFETGRHPINMKIVEGLIKKYLI